jgi:hypothetical protein
MIRPVKVAQSEKRKGGKKAVDDLSDGESFLAAGPVRFPKTKRLQSTSSMQDFFYSLCLFSFSFSFFVLSMKLTN